MAACLEGGGRRWLLDRPPRTRDVLAVPSQWPGLAWGQESPYFFPFPQLGIISPPRLPKGILRQVVWERF